MRRTIPIPSSTSNNYTLGPDRNTWPPTSTPTWVQAPIGGLTGAPSGGLGPTGSSRTKASGLGCHNRSTLPQDAQKGRPARPQRVKGRGVPSGYVEGLNDARTLLADFFSILLETATPRLLLDFRGIQAISTGSAISSVGSSPLHPAHTTVIDLQTRRSAQRDRRAHRG